MPLSNVRTRELHRRHRRGFLPTALTTTLTAATPLAAVASDGWYGQALGGVNWLSDGNLTYDDGTSTTDTASYDTGGLFGGSVGYQHGSWLIEGEVAYRSNDVGSLNLSGQPPVSEGDFASLAFAANIRYEIDLFGFERATTYLGGGLVWFQEIDIDLTEGGVQRSYSGDDTGFQLMAGSRYDLFDNAYLMAEYRYLDGGDIEMAFENQSTPKITADYQSHSLIFGVGYRF